MPGEPSVVYNKLLMILYLNNILPSIIGTSFLNKYRFRQYMVYNNHFNAKIEPYECWYKDVLPTFEKKEQESIRNNESFLVFLIALSNYVNDNLWILNPGTRQRDDLFNLKSSENLF